VSNGSDDVVATPGFLRSHLGGASVVASSIALWMLTTWTAAWSKGFPPFRSSSWDRWDSANYLAIADRGYELYRCTDATWGHLPGDWCGNAGWSPGFPAIMRLLRWNGLADVTNGWLISTLALIGAFTVLWVWLLRDLPAIQSLPAMALAAVFPSSVYYGAVFPVSLAVLSAVSMLALLRRERWLLAGMCGTVAAVVYPSGLLVGAAALAPLLSPRLGDWRRRIVATVQIGAPIAVAYALVLVQYQVRVGYWDAWFKNQANNHYERVLPIETLWRSWEKVAERTAPWVGAQALFTATLVVAATVVTLRRRRELEPLDIAILAMTLVMWLAPLTIGVGFSHYRADAFVLPLVVLLARSRWRWMPHATVALAVIAAIIAFNMAQLFFIAVLI